MLYSRPLFHRHDAHAVRTTADAPNHMMADKPAPSSRTGAPVIRRQKSARCGIFTPDSASKCGKSVAADKVSGVLKGAV